MCLRLSPGLSWRRRKEAAGWSCPRSHLPQILPHTLTQLSASPCHKHQPQFRTSACLR